MGSKKNMHFVTLRPDWQAVALQINEGEATHAILGVFRDR
jgi:hypothetical protein